MTKAMIDAFEWDNLLIPEEISSEEEELHSTMVIDYLSRQKEEAVESLSSIEKAEALKIDNSLLETKELDFDKISNEDLFNYFQSENKEIHPGILFPKMDKVHLVFWFLHNLGEKQQVRDEAFTIENSKELSIIFYQVIEAAAFFGFLKRTVADDTFYLFPTEQYTKFIDLPLEKQYHEFLASLGRNETISEVLQVQLNDTIYDNISKQMVHNILVKDPNIQNEGLTNDEVKKLSNNLRYWFLAIKQAILAN